MSSGTQDIETPTFARVIKDAIENRLVDLHVAMPCVVKSYDPSKQMVSVQPALQRKYLSGTVKALPVVNNIPVAHPRGGKAAVLLPITAGDEGWLVFSERSLDVWKSKGGVVDPDDTRKHHLSDAVYMPGGTSFPKALAGDPSDLVMVNDKAEVRVKSSGKASVKNLNTGDELVDLTQQMATALSTDTVNTIFGPMQLNNFSTYQTIATKLGNLKV